MYDRESIIESLEKYIPQDRPSIDFDTLYPPCRLLNLLTIQDIMQLNYIAKDRRLAGKPIEKQNRIKQIMMNRGFKKLAAGTNRLVFKYMEDQSFVIKVPFNAVGLRDNLDELYNQQYLKPFCTKVFEVSPCGTVGMFERVHGIRNREEFQLISSTIFDIIINKFIGQFVLADFGTKFFMNWGIRRKSYPVLLDFPYLYELDGAKLYCNRPDSLSQHGFCGGEIDYDNGFNHLICKKCGKTYLASELRLSENKKSKDILIEREDIGMIITISRGENIIHEIDTTKESDTYRKDKKGRRKETPVEYRERKACEGLKVIINKPNRDEEKPVDNENIDSKPAEEESQQSPTIDEFNHNYSLNSIPNDLEQMYRMNVSVNNSSKDRKKKEEEQSKPTKPIEPDVDVVEPISAQMYEMAQQIHERNTDAYSDSMVDNTDQSDDYTDKYNLKDEKITADEFYDQVKSNYQDKVSSENTTEQYDKWIAVDRSYPNKVRYASEGEGVSIIDYGDNDISEHDDENCGTNLGDILKETVDNIKDIADRTDEPTITVSQRPANSEVIIESRDNPEHVDDAFYD